MCQCGSADDRVYNSLAFVHYTKSNAQMAVVRLRPHYNSLHYSI
jgi:hypothetical protein